MEYFPLELLEKIFSYCEKKDYLNLMMINKRFFTIIIDDIALDVTALDVIAAKYNRLDCLQFLYDNNYVWSKNACITAYNYGNFECIKFLHNHGCMCNNKTIQFTLKNNCFKSFTFFINKLKP